MLWHETEWEQGRESANLLRSPKWSPTLLERFLWHRADRSLAQLEEQGQIVLAIWDESVLEKPESITLEGLCPVRSSKAARLRRIKPGFYNPPGWLPVFVPGLRWLTVMRWRGCRVLLSWPPCAGGPAGAAGPATRRNKPHRCSPNAPRGGRGGWHTSSTGNSRAHPGSRC